MYVLPPCHKADSPADSAKGRLTCRITGSHYRVILNSKQIDGPAVAVVIGAVAVVSKAVAVISGAVADFGEVSRAVPAQSVRLLLPCVSSWLRTWTPCDHRLISAFASIRVRSVKESARAFPRLLVLSAVECISQASLIVRQHASR